MKIIKYEICFNDEKSNVQFLHFANSDKPVKFYNLDVIISVGYRVKSIQGTKFRQWATEIIKEKYLRSSQELDNLFNSLSQKAFKGELKKGE